MNALPAEFPATFSPSLQTDDAQANYWLCQVTIRLRREITWLRYHHETQYAEQPAALSLYSDPLQTSLDLQRFWEEKKRFFQHDPTAEYLSNFIAAMPPVKATSTPRGTFSWVIQELELDHLSAFVLALSLAAVLDSAIGVVIAACLNNPNQTRPTLALAQKLWEHPQQIMPVADPNGPLFQHGLLQLGGNHPGQRSAFDWHAPLIVHPQVASQLLLENAAWPQGLNPISPKQANRHPLTDEAQIVVTKLQSRPPNALRVIPIRGTLGARQIEMANAMAQAAERTLVQYTGSDYNLEDEQYLNALATVCWLRDADLYLGQEYVPAAQKETKDSGKHFLPAQSIPLHLFIGISERDQLSGCSRKTLLPIVEVPELSYHERFALWKQVLGKKSRGLQSEIREVARRFRFQKEMITSIGETLCNLPDPITRDNLLTACRVELEIDIGELAQKVIPRFQDEKLILPPKQDRQFQEVITAMRCLTKVHYEWGTAKVWNEGGLAVLFAGPPGTGKTMGAEILAEELNMPMYRVDLSQVVNKYIGETEKNLKKLFDAADIADLILFFDEADALFGKRSEVKDAHDRYANLEISYLLERMERFKGLAILATNRKSDLDEAFLRRLRYIIDFPIPDEELRKAIWEQVTPGTVNTEDIDFDFLARNFAIAGGHIRSIMFNACLQSANLTQVKQDKYKGKLHMDEIIIATRREYDKLNRPISLENFGKYAEVVENLEREHAAG
jgi:hypothetical protein